MPNQHEYHELKEVDSPPEQNNTDDAEDTPIAVSLYYLVKTVKL